ncbi:MAG TPA: DUF4446 family protein [Candidatus Deferrimicrobium sp.]|nr:DUF4446 family protein [Candidatus Deferrimicrobium sp.]
MTGFNMNWVMDNLTVIVLALGIAILLTLLLVAILIQRLKKLTKVHKSLMTGMNGVNLEELLGNYLGKVQAAENKVAELNARSEKLEAYAQKSIQNISLLRFNAFENMGSDLSFAAAFLDLNGDGLVINSINSREESRVYAKPVLKGKSSYHLSDEEIEAINKAIESNKTIK